MEPKRSLIIQSIDLGDVYLKADTVVWMHEESSDSCRIEYKAKYFKVPKEHVVPLPVQPPSRECLEELDECFTRDEEYFDEIYKSEKYYRILKCKKHGATFFEDTRGSVCFYSVLIYIDELGEGYDDIWRKYHSISVDYLRFKGIAK